MGTFLLLLFGYIIGSLIYIVIKQNRIEREIAEERKRIEQQKSIQNGSGSTILK